MGALTWFGRARVDGVRVGLAWFGCSADQAVVLEACLALFALYFKISFEFGDFEVCVIPGLCKDYGCMVTDLLKVFLEGHI
jgi:hypothetical protein